MLAAATSTGLIAVALGSNSTTHGMLLRGMVKLDHDPGGNIGVAAGMQHRTESFNYSPDPLDESGIGNAPDQPIVGGQDVDAVFVEGILPVSDVLEVHAAVRYEDYGTVDTTDPKRVKKIIAQSQSNKIKIGYKFGLEFMNSKKGRQFISKLRNKIIFIDLKFSIWW